MNTPTRSIMAALMMTTLAVAPLAEAKRMGGGKSSGMSRSSTSSSASSNYNSTPQPVQPVRPVSAAPAPAASKPSSGIGMGTVAGAAVAAGAVGYMMGSSSDANATPSNTPTATSENPIADPASKTTAPPEEKGGFSWLWLIVLAAVGFFLFRRFTAQKAASTGQHPLHTQPTPFSAQPQHGFGQPNHGNNIFGQPVGGAGATGGFSPSSPFVGSDTLPDGTTKAAFLRQARSTFLHMQTMNGSGHLEELRRYFTPQMFEAVRTDIMTNKETAEFPQLNAQVIDTSTENNQYVSSVRFHGMVSEALDAPTQPFSEVWHFVKPTTGGEWLVAGIQQD
jgi:predicted lipid-binding transport protein (Tim44 family)